MIKRKLIRRKRNRTKKIIIITTLCLLFVITVGYAAFQTNLNITAKGNIKEKSRVIQSWTGTSNEDFHTDYYRENIVSATFLDTSNVPDNATESWNVSEDKKHGGVMAWVIPTAEDSTKYDLYIGANKGVIANENSSSFFASFSNLTSIVFENNFDTSNTVDMQDMFFHCASLLELDLSNFNTHKVTNMGRLFDGCVNLKYINLNGFNTSNVIDMHQMFYNCGNLIELDLSNFNTQNVYTMWYMFYLCNKIETLNLCSFNMTNVTNAGSMFRNTPKLKKVYVGNNWTTANADTTDMFLNSGVSEVTTGQC